jgi:hypothetical protein
MSTVTVPRKAGDAVGAIVRLTNKVSRRRTLPWVELPFGPRQECGDRVVPLVWAMIQRRPSARVQVIVDLRTRTTQGLFTKNNPFLPPAESAAVLYCLCPSLELAPFGRRLTPPVLSPRTWSTTSWEACCRRTVRPTPTTRPRVRAVADVFALVLSVHVVLGGGGGDFCCQSFPPCCCGVSRCSLLAIATSRGTCSTGGVGHTVVSPRRVGVRFAQLASGDHGLCLCLLFLLARVSPAGYSPFPGNTNQLILELGAYMETLVRTDGVVAEFVNPKYADPATRRVFKKPTRLECMMQDIAMALPTDATIGFTTFPSITYSPVKNNIESAIAGVKAGLTAACAITGEVRARVTATARTSTLAHALTHALTTHTTRCLCNATLSLP